jgi:SP family sugar:H+ symporter-like MFS transporter
MYISETAPTALRGSLGVVNQLSITVGVLVALAIGLLFDNTLKWWRLINLFAMLPCVACFFAAMFGPESPRWLVAQGDQDAARTLSNFFVLL